MKVHRTQSVRHVKVTTDGEGVVSHAGTALLAEMADRSGLTEGLSVAMGELIGYCQFLRCGFVHGATHTVQASP